MVSKVKRSENIVLKDPYLIHKNFTFETLLNMINKYKIYTYLVCDLT